MPTTPPKPPSAEAAERLERIRSASATKPALAMRTNDRVSFCTPPTLQVPETPQDRSAKIRADASARFEREKRRRASSISATKIPEGGPLPRSTLGGPSAKKICDKENSEIAAVEETSTNEEPRFTEASRWSSTSMKGVSATRDDSWSAALDARAWEEPVPQVAALEADLVDKMVWAPVGDDEKPGRVRKVWLDDKGAYFVGVELLQDHANATSTAFPCLPHRGVAVSPSSIRLLSWQD
jgi:hypothetical protein